MKQRLRRWFCRHQYVIIGRRWFGYVYHCPKCDGIFYDYGRKKKKYLGQFSDIVDEDCRLRV